LDHPPESSRKIEDHARTSAAPNDFFGALLNQLRNPSRLVLMWNWKSALLSILLRGPIFFVAAVRHGWQATVSALMVETAFCTVTAGFYGAIVQDLREAQPEWLTVLFLTVVLPIIFQVLEFVLHKFQGTPHLRLAEIASITVSAFSSLFNWYAMRRGALLVAGEGGSFGSDLIRLPRLFLSFLVALPRRIVERQKSRSGKALCSGCLR
jgi:hypothetical protein